MGLIDRQWALSPRPDDVKPWTALSEAQRDDQDLKMATFAAMVDRLDQNIGRLAARLQELGVDECADGRDFLLDLSAIQSSEVAGCFQYWRETRCNQARQNRISDPFPAPKPLIL
jgi:hypothetical protein